MPSARFDSNCLRNDDDAVVVRNHDIAGLNVDAGANDRDVDRTKRGFHGAFCRNTYAWQLTASYFLTGEEEAFRGFKPNSVFSLENGTWGAWELVARYHVLDPDNAAFEGGAASFADPNTQASKASAWALGVNWYLNENLKWVLNYEQTSFDGGDPGGADRDDEKAFLTRFALGF